MELNNSAEMNEPPLLAIGRQNYGLASAENDCQASGSAWAPIDCNGDWRPFSNDLSHTQSLQAQHRAKRQHCWSATSLIPNNADDQGPGPSSSHLVCDGGSMQSLHTELFGCCETTNAGNTGFDFLQTGLNLAPSSSSALPPHSLMLVNNPRQATASGTGHWSAGAGSGADLGSLFADGDWKVTRDLMSTSMGQSTESMKGRSLEHLHTNAGGGGIEIGGCQGSSCFSNALASQLESEGGKSASSINCPANQRPDQLHGDFRCAYKRKISSVDLPDASSFDPQFATRSESVAARTGGFGNNPDPNVFANFHPISNPSMIPVWGDPHNDSTEYDGNESELSQSFRGVSERTPGMIGSGEDTLRSLQNQPFSTPHESTQSQSHSLFARNLRRTVQSHTFTRRNPDGLGGNPASSTPALPGSDHWPPLVGERSPAPPPVLANWGASSGSRRNNSAFSSPVSRERGNFNGGFEGSRFRNMPGRTLDWAMAAAAAAAPASMEHRSTGQTIASGGLAVPTGREMDPPDSSARISQVANSLFNSGVLASYFPGTGSSVSRVNRHPPPPASVSTAPSHQPPVGPSLEAPSTLAGQHASRYASLSPSRGRREALLTAPVQSVLGLPFRGLHTLRADGEYRRQFLSEILNAMHHAFRSEDLNIEELVMLDPSIIYGGGGDAHDQHRDMRLDVDNMTYEELLALEERIGNVNTGLDEERISLCLRESKYSSLDATVAAISQESDVKCCICQEEFVEEEELGRLDCSHGYHSVCIKQWLSQKNECPICKSSAYMKS
eukprot:c21523_g1_i1 orf=643-2994(-)